MRRNDTQQVGQLAEELAKQLLLERGFAAIDLNECRRNYPTYDLLADKDGRTTRVSVKSARAARILRLGTATSVSRIDDDSVIMAFIPSAKGVEIDLRPGGYDLLIIPGGVAREDALAVHRHYVKTHPGSANHSIMVKDKIDRNPGTISGATFKSWHASYKDAWFVLESSGTP